MRETPEQWAKRMHEINKKNPQFCLHAFIDRYSEREHDYGPLKCYGPFTEQELDEYDLAHVAKTHVADQLWIFSYDLSATHEELMEAHERFIEELRPAEYAKFRKAKK